MAIRVAMATGGWVLLGELDKYTTVSARRFTSIKTDASGLELRLGGAAGEKRRLLFSLAFLMMMNKDGFPRQARDKGKKTQRI